MVVGEESVNVGRIQIKSFRTQESAKQLNIIFSPSNKLFILNNIQLRGNTLRLLDKESVYFLRKPGRTIKYIMSQVCEDTEQIVTIGSSKGGFAALMYATLLSRIFPNIKVSVRTFSPQISLWPISDNLPYPSYKKLIKDVEIDDALMHDLVRFGNPVQNIRKFRNLDVLVAYGNKNKVDTKEALLLRGIRNVSLMPLPIRTHLSLLPFVVDVRDKDLVRATISKFLQRDSNDIDAREIKMTENIESLVEDFYNLSDGGFDFDAPWLGLR